MESNPITKNFNKSGLDLLGLILVGRELASRSPQFEVFKTARLDGSFSMLECYIPEITFSLISDNTKVSLKENFDIFGKNVQIAYTKHSSYLTTINHGKDTEIRDSFIGECLTTLKTFKFETTIILSSIDKVLENLDEESKEKLAPVISAKDKCLHIIEELSDSLKDNFESVALVDSKKKVVIRDQHSRHYLDVSMDLEGK